jgi:hypothetical protein
MRNVAAVLSVLLPGLMISLSACSKKDAGGSTNAALSSVAGTAGGVKWSVPKGWTVQAERPMRIATYAVAAAEGDAEGAECAVSFFGTGQGGNVDANIDRWVGQFENPGLPSKASREVGGIKVTSVRVSGNYLAPGGPMMQSTGKKDNYRLNGAIVEAPDGLVFFKMTGPAKTVEAASAAFDAMVGSITK